MFAKFPDYPKIKMAIWWDGSDYTVDKVVAHSYILNESIEIMESFKKGLEDYK